MLNILRSRTFILIIVFLSITLSFYPFERTSFSQSKTAPEDQGKVVLALPEPLQTGLHSLEETLARRRTVRSFASRPLTAAQASQLLWAAQGVTSPEGYRTAPSGGGLYPLEIRMVAGNIEGIATGTWHYQPASHQLSLEHPADIREALIDAAYRQTWMGQGAAIFVISGVSARSSAKYGTRGVRFTYMEAGHAAQNLLLQAIGLGLEAGTVGGFDDAKVRAALHLPAEEEPLYLLVVGSPAP
ncbi:MAG TPA: SagB/ThcOx family dehydrogenase [Candidatus Ozemobacteraceae bacterium]|nr:SagB/ThcOx family dehydrogenase [Candidatus Ozemobacteraceae bacterium]